MKVQALKQNCDIILASTSPVRKKILEECALNFRAVAPFFDEDEAKKSVKNLDCKKKSLFLAKGKALSVSEKFPQSYVIGSDQICELEGKEMSKSKDKQEAFKQLKLLNGKIHYQNNAVAIYKNSKLVFKNYSKVKLQMRKLTDDEIKAYIELDDAFFTAGSYKFESFGKHLFQNFSGNYHAILGLNAVSILNYFFSQKLISFK